MASRTLMASCRLQFLHSQNDVITGAVAVAEDSDITKVDGANFTEQAPVENNMAAEAGLKEVVEGILFPDDGKDDGNASNKENGDTVTRAIENQELDTSKDPSVSLVDLS